ncbi:hypothetical protein A3753_27545 [Sulfitobacter sp. HI0082]|nr:hypothetical protein A3753_17580 [Sulfitobacter sp. HI0082]KZZ29236.1 hypothetical protein A3753_27545 [Sulfitobacter sp. HI0082]
MKRFSGLYVAHCSQQWRITLKNVSLMFPKTKGAKLHSLLHVVYLGASKPAKERKVQEKLVTKVM